MEIYELDRQRVSVALRQGWQGMRVFQGELTVDILRYETSGKDDALVVEGNETLVPGLSGLEVAVFPRLKKRKRIGGLIAYTDSDLTFILYDTEVLFTDRILYQEMQYEVLDVAYNSSSGRCRIEASKVK